MTITGTPGDGFLNRVVFNQETAHGAVYLEANKGLKTVALAANQVLLGNGASSDPTPATLAGTTNQITFSAGTFALANTVVFVTGYQVPTSGGTPSTYSFYQTTSYTSVFGVAGAPCATASLTIQIERNGNSVQAKVPYGSCTGSGVANSLPSITAMASQFRPATAICQPTTVTNGGTTTAGSVEIDTAGGITFFTAIGCTGSFTTSGTNAINVASFATQLQWNVN